MPALQVKECPDDVYERLRVCAANENRSIAQQTLTIIQGYLDALDERATADNVGRGRACAPMVASPSYAPERESPDYSLRREEALRRINAFAPLPVTKKAPAAADILARIRKEEAR